MQNCNGNNYINYTNIININTEKLFREAEDDLYYFNKITSAYKKLNKAVELTPNNFKSVLLLADVAFIKGYTLKALEFYKQANELKSSDFKSAAAIANCYKITGDFENALKYCNIALNNCEINDYSLLNQLLDIKIELLISQKRYKEAYNTLAIKNNNIKKFDFEFEFLHNKIEVQKKIKNSGLKVV